MQTGEIIVLAVVMLVLLGGLVSLGIGHRRWSIGTVVAGFLVLLAGATFFYFAARLAERERAWAKKVDDYRLRLAKADEDQVPDAEGVLGPPGGGLQSLERLRVRRDRWRRSLDRVDTWRDRFWRNASLEKPAKDDGTWLVKLAPEANVEDSPPIGVGSHVFLFDSAAFEDGGVYLGEFLVQSTSYDQAAKRHVLTVAKTSPSDAYDQKVLRGTHDSVIVYETLPVDRWLAFYRSRIRRVFEDDAGRIEVRTVGGKTNVAVKDPAGQEVYSGPIDTEDDLKNVPTAFRDWVRECVDKASEQPDKEDPDKVRDILESDPEIAALVRDFVETFRQHEDEVPKEEWEAAETEAAEKPGTLWAEVEFTKPHTFRADGAEPAPADGPKQDFEPGERTEFDLQTAVDLRDSSGVVTIQRVFRRRPLTDALTLLHGARAQAGDGLGVEGTSTLRTMLQDEVAALERSNARLEKAIAAARANTEDEARVAKELQEDLTGTPDKPNCWHRDVEEAGKLAAAFERELDDTRRALRAAEAAIVERGRELTALMTRLAREVDRVAPPPERRAAKP